MSKYDLNGSLLQSQEVDVRCQQKEVGSLKWEVGKGRGMKIPTQPHLSFVFSLLSSLLVLILATSCNPDRPNFEPSYSGAPPTEDLDQFLDTKTVFKGLDQVKGKRQQLDSLLTLADKLKNYDDDVALVYADTAYSMALEKNWELSRGIASYYIALLKGRREKYGEGIEDAMVDARISAQTFGELSNAEWSIRVNDLIGIFYKKSGELDSARYYLDKAFGTLHEGHLSDKDSILLRGELEHDLATYYFSVDSLELSKSFYKSSSDIYQSTGNLSALARLRHDWAQLYYNQGEFRLAEDLIRASLKYAHDHNDSLVFINSYQKLGILYNRIYRSSGKVEDLNKSMEYYLKCFQYQKEDLYFLYNQIGQNFQRAATIVDEQEVAYAYVDSAIISYKRAMFEARREGVLPIMRKMGRNISRLCDYRFRTQDKACQDLLDSSTADFLNTNYAGLTDTIGGILQVANQRNRTLQRRELEVKGKQRTRTQWLISGGSLLFAGLVFLLLLQRQQQKRLKAKMEALRAQINPHFISNSLNAIESLVNLDKKEAATKYLVHFSRLTRKVLNSSRDGKVSLGEEIKTIEHFLELEQLRFRDKLRYLIDIDEDIDPKEVEMPAMILQPYIENAIWHGIKPKQGPGLVKVQVERDSKYLVCTVKDNGIGRTKAAEVKAASVLQQNSVGMKINQERLNVVGRAKGAKVKINDLYDEEGNASGTQVIIRLPYKEITKT